MLHRWTLLLVIIGSVNVGLVTLTGVDLIGTMFGGMTHVINVLVGISGLYMLLTTYTTLLKKTA